MARPIHVILVTGFLGSGKTTFLNHAISSFPERIRVAVLMNEFAGLGIDAALLSPRDGMEIVEISKGSIFCICAKKDFLLGLSRIIDHVAPDLLLIEATGVANPMDVRKDLALGIFNSRFSFLSQICLVDTPNFEAAYHVYNSVENQIASSDLFVLNKTDLADLAQLETVKSLIAAHKDHPIFVEADHARIPVDGFVELIEKKGRKDREAETAAGAAFSATDRISSKIENISIQGGAPASGLAAAVYRWNGRTREDAEMLFTSLPEAVLRAKGFVIADGELLLLNRVMGSWRLDPLPDEIRNVSPALQNRIAIIAAPQELEKIGQSITPGLMVKESDHNPIEIFDMMPPGRSSN